jgi:superoxide dismutase
MLYSEIIAVCSQIHTKRLNMVHCVYKTYRAVNTLRLGYKNHSVNAVQWNNRCLFSDPHKTQIHCVGRTYRAVNTLRLGYKNQSVKAVQWNNRCSQIHTQHINTLCGQNAEYVNVKVGGTYDDEWASHVINSFNSFMPYFPKFTLITLSSNISCWLWTQVWHSYQSAPSVFSASWRHSQTVLCRNHGNHTVTPAITESHPHYLILYG